MKSWYVLFRFAPVLFLGLTACVDAAVLLPTGSTWRWRPGTNEASSPVQLWRQIEFADVQFTPAPAPFWYGDVLPGGTQITGMQNVYSCIFLRRPFMVANRAEIEGLRMGALVDDGFVAWINGTEVLRVNMADPAGTAVTRSTLAINASEPVSFNLYDLPDPASYLLSGTNVLAVQVFQSSLGSTDLGFECSLDSILHDTTAPTVVGVEPAPGLVTALDHVTVSFSEPVTGVTAAHLLVNGIGAATLTTVDGATYTFGFVQPAYGNVTIGWNPAHTIQDLAEPPNRFDASAAGSTWAYQIVDRTAPTVSAVIPAAGAMVRSLTNITVLFSEPVIGVDAADLEIGGKPATALTLVAASQYVFAFAQPATGGVQIAWAPGPGIVDLATPANGFSGGGWSYRLDPNAIEIGPYISEFMASNTRGLADENGTYSDWIEIYNPGKAAVNLEGWSLTDSAGNPAKWRFPATNLAGGAFLVVFASGKDRTVPGARLHTSFQLSAGGEYLALVRPDGAKVSEFAPTYSQQVPDLSFGFAQSGSPPEYTLGSVPVYFTTPTPGTVNLGGTAVPGPVLGEVRHTPLVPRDADDLVVNARVLPSFRAVAGVTLRYRIMFGGETSIPMWDDGAHGDGGIGDGVYGATIPANLSTNGQMIRYCVSATDVNGNPSRWPLFTNPTATEEYLGTVVGPDSVTSRLPVFHLFVASGQLAGIDTESGGRVAFFYDGEFYDNVYMELRGNTSAGLSKKSHRLEFNAGHELRHAGPGSRSRRSSLLAEYLDPAYLRQHLCFWFLENIGVRAPYHYPVRVQMNGAFYQFAFHTDVIGREQIERMGYDPTGALYKAVGNLVPNYSSTGVFQKLEPENDPSRADYLQLANGINETSTLAARRTAVFDLLDVPQVINHLAGSRWCAENDDVWANMSLYRDTYGDGLWRCIPFDMNASWGQLYGGSNPLEATVDSSKSHPLYGGSSTGGNYNRLYDVIVTLPETRQMLLRRERSILDGMVLPPGTPLTNCILETYILSMSNLISTEANLDRSRWGSSPWAPGKSFAQGVTDLINQFVGPRRQHWYITHCITNTSRTLGTGNANNAGIPLGQPLNICPAVVEVEFNPAGGNQEQEYVCISNTAPLAIDLSGWQLGGAVNFTFAPGTVLPSNSVAYVSPNPRAFRSRTTGPRGGQGRFVLGPYTGQLSARGEKIEIRNPLDQTVGAFDYPGAPSPAQRFLRITEIMFHPDALAGNPTAPDEFEYLELTNISTNTPVDLAGVRLVDGVEFNFAGSVVTRLEPGARVLVVKNASAFAARYGGTLPVAGQFVGNLDNDGERIRVLDSSNEEILDFNYGDNWQPLADGFGFSLVVVNPGANPEAWGDRSQWRLSQTTSGSPGAPEPTPVAIPPILINEVLTRCDAPPPLDTIELSNPTGQEADIGGWWLTDDFNTPAKFRIPTGTTMPAAGYLTFDASQFNVGSTAFGLGADGDEVWLFSAGASGQLTGYVHGYRFGAAEDRVSFGRHVTSDGDEHFVAQIAPSLGAANVGPRVGPVVISEIQYHPGNPGGTDTSSGAEYIELLNTSANAVSLFEHDRPSNAWRLRGGVTFDFPTNVVLDAFEFVLVVDFDPANTVAASAFRSRYGLGPAPRLFGPFTGRLDNAGEGVVLEKPAVLPTDVVACVEIERVEYRDTKPWPAGADGLGLSLQRRFPIEYGNDPAQWVAAPPTPAQATAKGLAPLITVQPISQSVLAYQTVSFTVSATGVPPLRYQWRWNGTALIGATNAMLSLARIAPSQAGAYDALVFNAAGSALSSTAFLDLTYPASILVQPVSTSVRPGSNVGFGVTAYSPGPIAFQWRRNGVNIAGANGPTLSVRNVQFVDGGDYTVVVTDTVGSVVSLPATLTVLIDPVVTSSLLSLDVIPGATVVLSVTVTNTATLPIGYRLRRNDTLVPASVPGAFVTLDQRTAYFTLSAADTMPPWTNYSVLVTNVAKPDGHISPSTLLNYQVDSDADGLPEAWELRYFPTTGTDPAQDPDGDGSVNRDEYLAGTNPLDPASCLRVDLLSPTPGARVGFTAASNHTYTVEFTDSIGMAPWRKLADIPTSPAAQNITVEDPQATGQRIYRLVTPRQP